MGKLFEKFSHCVREVWELNKYDIRHSTGILYNIPSVSLGFHICILFAIRSTCSPDTGQTKERLYSQNVKEYIGSILHIQYITYSILPDLPEEP